MSASIDQIINRAASQIGGYYPGNSPYGVWYGSRHGEVYNNAQFCYMGLSWVFAHEAALDIFPEGAYTPSGVSAFKSMGRWTPGISGVRRGDVVFFDFPGAPNRVSHVGIVESVNGDGSVNTIEFNTSGTAAGDQRNGRVVARKRRKAYIVGYGRPAYSAAGNPIDNRPRNADGSLTLVIDGVRGPATIGRWQEVMGSPIDFVISTPESTLIKFDQGFLNRVVAAQHIKNLTGKSSLTVDGDEGKRTIIVRQFWLRNAVNVQHQINLIGHPLDFDGVLGPETNKVHQFALNNATTASGQYGIVP
jgi:hypothetical protein